MKQAYGEQVYKDFLLGREKYMAVCYIDEVFYCDHNNRLHITFKEAFPQEYEKRIVPGFETALTLIHGGKELMVTMFNMKVANKDEILNILKKYFLKLL